jgi:hypothetical protein
MTRIWSDGFEGGDFKRYNIATATNSPIISTTKRSGNYSYELKARKNQSSGYLYFSFTPSEEIYFRVAVYEAHDYSCFKIMLGDLTTLNNMFRIERIYDTRTSITFSVGGNVIGTAPYRITKTWVLYEGRIKMADVDGRITIKRDGIVIFDYSGDTKASTATVLDTMWVYVNGTNSYVTSSTFFDDIAVNNTEGLVDNGWCGDGRILAIKPNANGDVSQLNGSDGDQVDNYLLVDDIPSDNDVSYVSSAVVDDYDLYNLQDISIAEYYKIQRLWPEMRAKDDSLGAIAPMIKSGITEDVDISKSLTASYAAILGKEYLKNPDNDLDWEHLDVNALQVGVKIK